MGSSDPGAATHEQYGGMAVESVAPIAKVYKKIENAVAALSIPAFLSNAIGSSNFGAAARKQYDGLGVRSKGPTSNIIEKIENAVVTATTRSSSPQVSGLRASKWATPAQTTLAAPG